jgi:hypothetical protein
MLLMLLPSLPCTCNVLALSLFDHFLVIFYLQELLEMLQAFVRVRPTRIMLLRFDVPCTLASIQLSIVISFNWLFHST